MEFEEMYVGLGFLQCFPRCAFFSIFTIFQKTGRQIPQTILRLNGAFAQHDFVAKDWKTTDDDPRISIKYASAMITNKTLMRVSFRNFEG